MVRLLPMRSKPVRSCRVPKTRKIDVDKSKLSSYPTNRSLGRPAHRAVRSLLRQQKCLRKAKSYLSTTSQTRAGSQRRPRTRSAHRLIGAKARRNVLADLMGERIPGVSTDDNTTAEEIVQAIAREFPMMQTLENYGLEEEIYEGSFGKVGMYRDKRTDEDVAIKRIDLSDYDTEEHKECLIAELGIMLTIDSPYLVKAREWYAQGSMLYIVMDLAEDSLYLLQESTPRGRLTEYQTANIAKNVLFSLRELHARGIIHWDIKDENVLMYPDGKIRLADYGLSRSVGSGRREPLDFTTEFTSPEELDGEWVSLKKDLWNLGVMLYRCLTAKDPFGEVRTRSQKRRLKNCEVIFPHGANVSPEFSDFLSRLLCREEDRMDIGTLLGHPFITTNNN